MTQREQWLVDMIDRLAAIICELQFEDPHTTIQKTHMQTLHDAAVLVADIKKE